MRAAPQGYSRVLSYHVTFSVKWITRGLPLVVVIRPKLVESKPKKIARSRKVTADEDEADLIAAK